MPIAPGSSIRRSRGYVVVLSASDSIHSWKDSIGCGTPPRPVRTPWSLNRSFRAASDGSGAAGGRVRRSGTEDELHGRKDRPRAEEERERRRDRGGLSRIRLAGSLGRAVDPVDARRHQPRPLPADDRCPRARSGRRCDDRDPAGRTRDRVDAARTGWRPRDPSSIASADWRQTEARRLAQDAGPGQAESIARGRPRADRKSLNDRVAAAFMSGGSLSIGALLTSDSIQDADRSAAVHAERRAGRRRSRHAGGRHGGGDATPGGAAPAGRSSGGEGRRRAGGPAGADRRPCAGAQRPRGRARGGAGGGRGAVARPRRWLE